MVPRNDVTDAAEAVTSFGSLLRGYRLAAGLTQEELADKSGLSARAISDLERGRTARPFMRSVRMLANAMDLTDDQRARFVRHVVGNNAALVGTTVDAAHTDNEAGRERPEPVLRPSGQAAAPRQLPRAHPYFCGREPELAVLSALPLETGNPACVALISGPAGVGKTALALHWAHQAAELFPDGQLYVDLRGFDPSDQPVSPSQAIRWFLDALNVPQDRIPADLEAQAGLYRSLVADRRILILLDNAADAGQARLLIPGSERCMTVITSRSLLPGLVASHAARALRLGMLNRSEARELLALRLGPKRLAADPTSVARLISVCAGLPLALAVSAALAATHPQRSLAHLVDELTTAETRLDALATGDPATDLRTVFHASFRALSDGTAQVFCLLGEHPGPDMTPAAVASLAGVTLTEASAALAELTQASLVTEPVPGRYGFHDLLREFAARQLRELRSADERRAAGQRMLEHYVRTATAAALAITPRRNLQVADEPVPGVRPEHIDSQDEAFAWLRAEHAVLMRVIAYAADTGADNFAWRIPLALTDFHDRAGYWHDWAACQEIALAAAERLGDIAAQSNAHRYLGRACFYIKQDDALQHMTRSVQLRHQIGPPAAEAGIHIDISRLQGQRGDAVSALQSAQQALSLYQAAQHRVGEAHALNAVGFFHALAGDYVEALRFCSAALGLATEAADLRAEAEAWQSLGVIHQETGDSAQAIGCYQRSLALHRVLADRYMTAKLLTHLGDAHQAAVDIDAARTAWIEALAILDDLGHPDADQVRARLDGR
jgi:transcriptional regulator with XRE-family HTH domain/tetratricopeptide (TPR) repeat protein